VSGVAALQLTVWVLAKAGLLKNVSLNIAQKLIEVQMFNYFRQPCFCQYLVSGSLFSVLL
jgi:hypothetical protein